MPKRASKRGQVGHEEQAVDAAIPGGRALELGRGGGVPSAPPPDVEVWRGVAEKIDYTRKFCT